MPRWNFSISPQKNKNKTRKSKGYIIEILNAKAVVDINNRLLYIACFEDGRRFLIHKDCYKCKNKQVIYSQCLVGEFKQRLIIHRIPSYCIEHRPYLPFAVGCVIEGDVIVNQDTLIRYFKIKKCYIDSNNKFADAITRSFREIYDDELEQRIVQHYSTFDYDTI